MRLFRRSFAVVGLAGLALASVVSASPTAHAAATARAASARSSALAPVGTVIAHATSVSANAPAVPAAALPKGAFINRPTMPISTYLAAKRAPRPAVQRNAALTPQPRTATELHGFDGTTQAKSGNVFPPAINGTVGGTQVAEVTNSALTIYAKASPNTKQANKTLASVMSYSTAALFDPRIVYDTTWNRWVMHAAAFPESGTVQIEALTITKGKNANGPYWNYLINAKQVCGSSNFFDYPQIGLQQDAVVVTANCFDGANNYLGARVFAVSKAVLYNGLGFSVPVFVSSAANGTATPSIVLDANPAMFLNTTSQHLLQLNNPGNGFYATMANKGVVTGGATFRVPPQAGQAGCTTTSCLIDTGDGRFQAPGIQMNNQLWNVATYGFAGGTSFAAPYWSEADTTAMSTIQFGTRFVSSCSNDWNASLTVQPNGNMWLNWSSSQAPGCNGGTFVQNAIATRISTDANNTLPGIVVPFTSAAELTGNFDANLGYQRWGPTSSTTNDTNQSIAWTWNESVVNATNWGTRSEKISDS